jgi:ATP-binding cassette subfamily B (MDR/TAP) protein 1
MGNIEFVDVRFRYPSRPTLRILKDFSLKCSSGETTALVGPSGSGKSTTIALLQRFYDPLKGKVLLDGHDIKVLNIQWLRSLMGLVQQEPVLFDLSIRDNIAYGDNSREVTQHEIEAAARMANIHELVASLPKVHLFVFFLNFHLTECVNTVGL